MRGATQVEQSVALTKTKLKRWGWWISSSILVSVLAGMLLLSWQWQRARYFLWRSPTPDQIAPLAMSGGNPYIRALMRTISASESGGPNPYNTLYGGEQFQDLSHHPDQCIAILFGPNMGDCTTAAGRYQFITTTWEEKAELYHPDPTGWLIWTTYSFEPVYQDQVVYTWLTDPYAWGGEDLVALLEAGELSKVLELLSSTWTSLGYGIEDNRVTPYLADIYQEMLTEELAKAQAVQR